MPSELDVAVRIARAEIERDQALKRAEDAYESTRRLLAGHPITLYGKPPEYWLALENCLEGISEQNGSGHWGRLARQALKAT